MLKPSDIYFSQDSINNMFRENCLHCYTSIGKTLDDLCEGLIIVEDIPTISVMDKNGKWFTGDNRRLWIFRHLERLGKCTTIPVYETSYIPLNKFTTDNGGVSVEVRRNPGGRWHLKPSATHKIRTQRRPASPVRVFPTRYGQVESPPRSFDTFGSFSTTGSSLKHSPASYRPTSYSFRSSPEPTFRIGNSVSLINQNINTRFNSGVQDVQKSFSSMQLVDITNVIYVDPQDCRYLKETIDSHFDDRRSCDLLKQNLIYGRTSYRDVPAVKAFKAYDVYYVQDGNRRLKAFKDATYSIVLSDIKIKVNVIGDEDDLLDELRNDDPAITAFEVMQMGETVEVI